MGMSIKILEEKKEILKFLNGGLNDLNKILYSNFNCLIEDNQSKKLISKFLEVSFNTEEMVRTLKNVYYNDKVITINTKVCVPMTYKNIVSIISNNVADYPFNIDYVNISSDEECMVISINSDQNTFKIVLLKSEVLEIFALGNASDKEATILDSYLLL